MVFIRLSLGRTNGASVFCDVGVGQRGATKLSHGVQKLSPGREGLVGEKAGVNLGSEFVVHQIFGAEGRYNSIIPA